LFNQLSDQIEPIIHENIVFAPILKVNGHGFHTLSGLHFYLWTIKTIGFLVLLFINNKKSYFCHVA